MKTSIQNRPIRSALFRLAARAENLAALQALAVSPMPFAELMLHPEKLKAVLAALESWKQKMVVTPRRAARLFRTTKAAPQQPRGVSRSPGNPLNGLINTEFRLEAPAAESVRLIADFTDWETSPLDLIRGNDGVWFIIVPLLPGRYSYRFVVDGQWRDDPRPEQFVANPFGTVDAVVNVV